MTALEIIEKSRQKHKDTTPTIMSLSSEKRELKGEVMKAQASSKVIDMIVEELKTTIMEAEHKKLSKYEVDMLVSSWIQNTVEAVTYSALGAKGDEGTCINALNKAGTAMETAAGFIRGCLNNSSVLKALRKEEKK